MLPITTPFVVCDRANVWPPIVAIGVDGREGNGIVDVPITSPLEPRDTGFPATVKISAFGVTVLPATTTSPLWRTVTDLPATVTMPATAAAVEEGRGIVDVPTTSPPSPSKIGVSAIVIAGAFSTRDVP